eukprot:scaffold6580_cov60-Phaeocystis_antarctica.AAC.9
MALEASRLRRLSWSVCRRELVELRRTRCEELLPRSSTAGLPPRWHYTITRPDSTRYDHARNRESNRLSSKRNYTHTIYCLICTLHAGFYTANIPAWNSIDSKTCRRGYATAYRAGSKGHFLLGHRLAGRTGWRARWERCRLCLTKRCRPLGRLDINSEL